MTGYEPRVEPPAFPTRRTPWAVVPLVVWFHLELPFIAAWFLREKFRSVQATRKNLALSTALAMEKTLSIAVSADVPTNRRQRALAAARNLRSLATTLRLQHYDMVSGQLERLEDLEERGLR